jgi:hypothetical protein
MSHQPFLVSCNQKKNETMKATSTIHIKINTYITLFKSVYIYTCGRRTKWDLGKGWAHSFVTARTLSTNRCNI